MQLSKSKIIIITISIMLFLFLIIGCVVYFPKENDNKIRADTSGDWTYYVSQYDTYTEVTITGYSGSAKKIVFPSVLGGYPVTSISYNLFRNNTSIQEVVIPDSVQSIGSAAFYGCSNLKTVTLGTGLTSLGNGAFENCYYLEKLYFNSINLGGGNGTSDWFDATGTYGAGIDIVIGQQVTQIPPYFMSQSDGTDPKFIGLTFSEGSQCESIGDRAFQASTDYGLTELDLTPCTKLKSIGTYAFHWNHLTHLVIPDSVTEIGSYAFCGAVSDSVTIGKGVKTIGGHAFADLNSLNVLNYNATNASDATSEGWFFSRVGYSEGVILNIGENVEHIPAYLFSGSYPPFLAEINFLGNNLKSIGIYAFSRDNGDSSMPLSTLTIPESVTSIGKDAFSYFTNVTTINYNAVSVSDLPSSDNAFSNLGANITSPVVLNIGEKVKRIPAYLFKGAGNLTTINFPENGICEEIGNGAFMNDEINGVILPNTIKVIGNGAFQSSAVTNVSFGSNIEKIGQYAFADSTWLTNLQSTSPEGIATARDGVTKYAIAVANVEHTPNYANVRVFADYYAYSKSYVKGAIVIPSTTIRIGNNSFSSTTNVTTLTIENGVQFIDDYAFSNSYITGSLIIPDSVTYIGKQAFRYVTKITGDCVIGNNVEFIGEYAFSNNLFVNLTLGNSIKTIEQHAFYNLSNITSITTPESLETIGTGAFASCSNVLTATIKGNLNSIGENAFNSLTNLKSVYFHQRDNFIINTNAFTQESSNCIYYFKSQKILDYVSQYYGNTTYFTTTNFVALDSEVYFNATEGGVVSNAGSSSYDAEQVVSSTATPNSHYKFVKWTETYLGKTTDYATTPTISITVSHDAIYTAIFDKVDYNIQISSTSATAGTLTITKDNILIDANSLDTTAKSYSIFKISASANNGYTFIGWQNKNGVIETTNPVLTINLLENKTYTAMFGSAVQTDSICLLDSALIASINTNTKVVTKQESNTLTAIGYTSFLNYSTTDNLDSVRVWATPSTGYEFACWAVENEAGQLIALTDTNGNLYESIADIPVTSQIEGKILIACFKEI